MTHRHLLKWAIPLLGAALAACGGSTPPAASSGPVSLAALADSADITPPSAPSNLAWTNVGMTVTLTWGASTDDVGVVSYDLWYGSFFLGTFSDTSISLIGFKSGTQYTFTVKARDAAGNTSVASNQTTVILGQQVDSTPPSTPSNLRSTNVTASSVSLAWNASSDDTGVVVYHVYSNGQIVANPTSTSANVTGLSSSTSYTFTVTAQDATGNVSNASSPLSVTTLQGADTTPPSAPTNLVASNVTGTSVTLSWGASTDNVGIASYLVYDGSVAAGPVATTSGLSASVTGLSPGTSHTYAVMAKDTSGNVSNTSNTVVVNTTASYSLTIAVSGNGTTSPAAGTYSYPAGTTVTVTATPSSSSYAFSGWSGAASGTSNPVSIVVTGNATLTATFAVQQSSLSINVGGAATGSFVADEYFSGGTTYSNTNTIDTSALTTTVPAAVFQSERYGESTYTIPNLTASSPYIVTLYFAETYLSAAGARIFDVNINGATALSGFDIFAAAGAQNKAIARSFNATATSSGQIAIQFTSGSSGVENPKVCGITIDPGSLPTYTLTVTKSSSSGSATGTVSGGGINCGSTCTASIVKGNSVTLTAKGDTGFTLDSWGGACSGSSSTCTVTMDAAKTVTASFKVGSSAQGPCDIYEAAGTPCVAAHSTVRALYGTYTGYLYQVRRSDNSTKDIPVLTAGGFADTSVQNSFCGSSSCTISIIYDQSPKGNHLKKSGTATWLSNGGSESSATAGKATASGHTVYGIYVTAYSGNVAYRNNSTNGVAKGNQAESMYMVVDGTRYSKDCCFDYGNAETDAKDDGNGTMAALYWGTDTSWGGQGDGNGPWIAADLENGMFKGNAGCYNCNPGPYPSAKSLPYRYVSAFLKDPAANTFTLKGGNAQSGSLMTMWNSSRPSPNYFPKSLQGAIILGTGGDGSNGGSGTFYEGAMTIGDPPGTTEDLIQANIIAAGYGQ